MTDCVRYFKYIVCIFFYGNVLWILIFNVVVMEKTILFGLSKFLIIVIYIYVCNLWKSPFVLFLTITSRFFSTAEELQIISEIM